MQQWSCSSSPAAAVALGAWEATATHARGHAVLARCKPVVLKQWWRWHQVTLRTDLAFPGPGLHSALGCANEEGLLMHATAAALGPGGVYRA